MIYSKSISHNQLCQFGELVLLIGGAGALKQTKMVKVGILSHQGWEREGGLTESQVFIETRPKQNKTKEITNFERCNLFGFVPFV